MRGGDPGYGAPSHGTQQLDDGLADGVEHDQHCEQVDDEAGAQVDLKHSCRRKASKKIAYYFAGKTWQVRQSHQMVRTTLYFFVSRTNFTNWMESQEAWNLFILVDLFHGSSKTTQMMTSLYFFFSILDPFQMCNLSGCHVWYLLSNMYEALSCQYWRSRLHTNVPLDQGVPSMTSRHYAIV